MPLVDAHVAYTGSEIEHFFNSSSLTPSQDTYDLPEDTDRIFNAAIMQRPDATTIKLDLHINVKLPDGILNHIIPDFIPVPTEAEQAFKKRAKLRALELAEEYALVFALDYLDRRRLQEEERLTAGIISLEEGRNHAPLSLAEDGNIQPDTSLAPDEYEYSLPATPPSKFIIDIDDEEDDDDLEFDSINLSELDISDLDISGLDYSDMPPLEPPTPSSFSNNSQYSSTNSSPRALEEWDFNSLERVIFNATAAASSPVEENNPIPPLPEASTSAVTLGLPRFFNAEPAPLTLPTFSTDIEKHGLKLLTYTYYLNAVDCGQIGRDTLARFNQIQVMKLASAAIIALMQKGICDTTFACWLLAHEVKVIENPFYLQKILDGEISFFQFTDLSEEEGKVLNLPGIIDLQKNHPGIPIQEIKKISLCAALLFADESCQQFLSQENLKSMVHIYNFVTAIENKKDPEELAVRLNQVCEQDNFSRTEIIAGTIAILLMRLKNQPSTRPSVKEKIDALEKTARDEKCSADVNNIWIGGFRELVNDLRKIMATPQHAIIRGAGNTAAPISLLFKGKKMLPGYEEIFNYETIINQLHPRHEEPNLRARL